MQHKILKIMFWFMLSNIWLASMQIPTYAFNYNAVKYESP